MHFARNLLVGSVRSRGLPRGIAVPSAANWPQLSRWSRSKDAQ